MAGFFASDQPLGFIFLRSKSIRR
ncbi:uncharacterized protein METZ01_LOCUS451495 [marine metagenome]|uniref:Uncharacterized protein n=1 Tax=marine metagenome TaxID=408172 RepID=A0A382ZT62_9ZZZZ